MKVLIVDDEKLIVKGLKFSLEQDGPEVLVDCAYDGETALNMAKKGKYDIILLDIMLPGLTGLEVCEKIREFSNVPIIMLTAKSDDADKIEGLECGADDYVTKPFNVMEVKARIKAVMRRSSTDSRGAVSGNSLKIKDMVIDRENERLLIRGKEISLTAREFDVLELLASNAGKVYSREKLLETIWGEDYPGDVRTVDVHIRRLREKVEDIPSAPRYIQTKWGLGYYFDNH